MRSVCVDCRTVWCALLGILQNCGEGVRSSHIGNDGSQIWENSSPGNGVSFCVGLRQGSVHYTPALEPNCVSSGGIIVKSERHGDVQSSL